MQNCAEYSVVVKGRFPWVGIAYLASVCILDQGCCPKHNLVVYGKFLLQALGLAQQYFSICIHTLILLVNGCVAAQATPGFLAVL